MEHIRLTQEGIDALLQRVKANALDKGDYGIIKSMAEAIMTLGQAMDNKTASIKRLLAMLFGPKTEKKNNVLKKNEPEQTDEDSKETEIVKENKKPPKAKPKKNKDMERYLLPNIVKPIKSSYPMKSLSTRTLVLYALPASSTQ